jgi:hypothetical protein
MTITGSCLCKSVNYEITGALDVMGNCHCSICRKSHGAAFVTWAIVNPEQFRWTSGEEFVQGYDSSPGIQRCFCKKCGSTLATAHDGKIAEVAVGTIDGDPGIRPGAHIFVNSKANWYEITDELPQFAEWPPGMEP